VFAADRSSKLHTVRLAKFCTKPHRIVGLCELLMTQAQTVPAVVLERKQTAGMHVMCGK
jgi:hypothetical protein